MASETLPQVKGPSVEVSGQTPGFQSVDYNPESFGSGIGRALLQTSDTFANAAKTEAVLADQKKANDVLTDINAAKDELRPWLFDPKDGAFAKQGGQAQGLGVQMDSVLTDIKDRYLKKITDPKTKQTFEKLWSAEAESTKDKVANHELDQLSKYKAETNKGTILSSMQDAYNYYNDPKAIDKAIADTRRAIHVNSTGMAPELLKSAEDDAVSGIHLAVINRLAQEDPGKALEYAKAHDKDITGADHVQAYQFTKDARAQQNAQTWVAQRRQGASGSQAAYDLGDAVIFAESGGNGDQESSAGATGITQIIPSTARIIATRIGRADIAAMTDDQIKQTLRSDDALARTMGRNELGHLLKKYHGDVEAALVGYNAGEGSADEFLKHNVGRGPGQRDYNVPGYSKVKSETEPYVQKVLKAYSDNRPNAAIGSTPPGTRMTRGNWTLKNFAPEDLTAPTPGGAWVDAHAATALDNVVSQMKAEFPDFNAQGVVNLPRSAKGETAGRRRGTADPNDNPHVKHSEHLRGDAFDVQIQGWTNEQRAAFLIKARQAGFGGVGFYGPNGHLHIDMGKPRTWGPMPAWAGNAMQVKIGGGGKNRGGQDPIDLAGADSPLDGAGYPGGYGNGVANTNKPALMQLLQESETITDPREREIAQSMIRTQVAVDEATDKAQTAAVKQAAWDAVLQGQTIPPQIASRLGREEYTALQSYQEKLAAGALATDYDRLIAFKSGTTAEKASTDINDLRPYLSKSDTDEVANMIAQARAAQNGDANAKLLESAMRSRSEIVNGAASMMGWDAKGAGQSGKEAKALLDRRLDDQMAIELANNGGKPLNGQQIQDIVDKLLIKDKATGLFSRGQGTASQVKDPDNFIAANDWTEVDPDDQATLINAYEGIYKAKPDKDTATRLYNSAMQLYLGGRPKPTDDETYSIAQSFSSKRGRPPKQEEVDEIYGRYLLKLLGR